MAGKLIRRRDRPSEEEGRSETSSDIRLLRAQRMASAKSGCTIASECGPGLSHAAPRCRPLEKRDQSAGALYVARGAPGGRALPLPCTRALCKIALIPNQVS